MTLSKSKLRPLISEKLVEIGCLLDEELPDYIAAMVANGKSREHMNKELSVFIGVQSEPFLDWLTQMTTGTKDESASIKSTARLISRERPESSQSPSKRGSSQPSANSTSGRLLSLAVAKAAADTGRPHSGSGDTGSARKPQPVAEGSSSHSSSSSRRRLHGSPESRQRESRNPRSRSSSENTSREDKAQPQVKTKFVVTLDGAATFKESLEKKREVVDPSIPVTFIVNTHAGELKRTHVEVEEEEQEQENGGTPGGEEVQYDPVEQQPAEEASEPAAKRSLERCRYWPNCASAESCQFHHPSTPCRNFPACTYGDQCLYVHPDCKFGMHCARPGCHFLHRGVQAGKGRGPGNGALQMTSTVKPSPAKASASGTICKFHPNCARPGCTFLHPTPCRFGGQCTRQGCNFYHAPAVDPVSVPGWKSLRWSAKGAHVSDRKFALDTPAEFLPPGGNSDESATVDAV